MNPVLFKLSGKTDVGRVRANNEDNFIVNPDLSKNQWELPAGQEEFSTLGKKGALLVVADGMGGLDAGEIASRIAVDTLKDCFTPDKIGSRVVNSLPSIRQFMRNAIITADDNIKRASSIENGIKSMGTTIVAAWLLNGNIYVSWCGDSRLYLFDPLSGLSQLTTDHSYVQDLIDAGRLSPELAFDHPYSNIITRSLGNPDEPADPGFISARLKDGMSLLLCTDGLNSMLRDSEIGGIMQDYPEPLGACTDALIRKALDNGGHDNVTVILCSVRMDQEEPQRGGFDTICEFGRKGYFSRRTVWLLASVIALLALVTLLLLL
ncbi:hypothetical protein FACS1894181_04560 [Bacteroidia bacterium]|nr:hypothetical protein FACS1894181_04560 [Bacteroidia bacterium]